MANLFVSKTIANNRVNYLDLGIDPSKPHKDQILVRRLLDFSSVYALNDNTPSADLEDSPPTVRETRTIYTLPSSSASGSSMYTVDESTHEVVFSTATADYKWLGGGVHHSRINNNGVAYDIQLPVAAAGETVQVIRKAVINIAYTAFSADAQVKSTDLHYFYKQIADTLEEALAEIRHPELNIQLGTPIGLCSLDTSSKVSTDNLSSAMTGLKSTGTITFTGTSVTDGTETVILISTDGTTKTYTAWPSTSIPDRQFKADTSAVFSAARLKECIEGDGNHSGKISVVDDLAGKLTLTQETGGTDGNRAIVETLTNCTAVDFASIVEGDITGSNLEDLKNVDLTGLLYSGLNGYELGWDGLKWVPRYPLFGIVSPTSIDDNAVLSWNTDTLELKLPVLQNLTNVNVTATGAALQGQVILSKINQSWRSSKRYAPHQFATLEWDDTFKVYFPGHQVDDTEPKVNGFLYGGTNVPFAGVETDSHCADNPCPQNYQGLPNTPSDGSYFGEPWNTSGTATVLSDFGDVTIDYSIPAWNTSGDTVNQFMGTQLIVWDTSLTNTITDDDGNLIVNGGVGQWTNKHVNLQDMTRPTGEGGYGDDDGGYPRPPIKIDYPTESFVPDGQVLQWNSSNSTWESKTAREALETYYTNITSGGWVEDAVLIADGPNDLANRPLKLDEVGFMRLTNDGETTGAKPAEGAKIVWNDQGQYWGATAWEGEAEDTVEYGTANLMVSFNKDLPAFGDADYYVNRVETILIPRDMTITGIQLLSVTGASLVRPELQPNLTFGRSDYYHQNWRAADGSKGIGEAFTEGWLIYHENANTWDEDGDPTGLDSSIELISRAKPDDGTSNDWVGTEGDQGPFWGMITYSDIYHIDGFGNQLLPNNSKTNLTDHNTADGYGYSPITQTTLSQGDLLHFVYKESWAHSNPVFHDPDQSWRQSTIVLYGDEGISA